MKLGALEAGGTKMVCAVGTEDGKILKRETFPTRNPEETIADILDFFRESEICALGIGCFGPVDIRTESETYGKILDTPKLAWRGFDIVGAFKEGLNIPVAIDTDVNGSLIGEATWGAAKGLTDAIYITIGTGIGGGILSNGKPIHGMLHPELGHMPIARVSGDIYKGKCPYHADCFEGMASGPALEERFGLPAKELADRADVWELESEYIAQALVTLILSLSPQRIILGGGVMHQKQVFPLIREKVKKRMNGYIRMKEFEEIENYIVPPMLGDDQGILGALKLSEGAFHLYKSVEELHK